MVSRSSFVAALAGSALLVGCLAQPTHDLREDPSMFAPSTDPTTNGAGSAYAQQLVGDYRSGGLYPRFSLRADGSYTWDDAACAAPPCLPGEVGKHSLWNDGHGRNYVQLLATDGNAPRWFRVDGVAPTLLVGIAGTNGSFHGITPPGGCTSSLECSGGEQCVGGACVASPLCVQLTTPDGVVHARNFLAGSYAEASAWASSTAAGGGYVIRYATCAYLVATTVCNDAPAPTCAFVSGADGSATFGSACEVMRAVTDAAGDGEGIGITHAGACAPDVTSCAHYTRPSSDGSFTYFAHMFGSTFEADAWLQLNPDAASPSVFADDCTNAPACPAEDKPVCGGVRFGPARTYANQCVFEAAVLHDTAATGWSKGFASSGGCP